MAGPGAEKKPHVMDEDAKFEFLQKKAKRHYKNQVRKFRREAESDTGELNLVAMMDMMTILLVFLIKSFSSTSITVTMTDDLMPPSSKSTLQPVEAVTVTITKKDISVAERGVVRLEPGLKVPADAKDPNSPLLIVPLKDELDKEVDKNLKIQEFNPAQRALRGTPKDPVKMLTIVGDQDVPYELLFSVLGTAGQSGLKYFKFLVINATG